jgi:hypothetical protein
MKASQVVALVLLLLVIGGLAFTFVRHGAKVKPDDNPDNWRQHTGGGGGATGGDGAGPPS